MKELEISVEQNHWSLRTASAQKKLRGRVSGSVSFILSAASQTGRGVAAIGDSSGAGLHYNPGSWVCCLTVHEELIAQESPWTLCNWFASQGSYVMLCRTQGIGGDPIATGSERGFTDCLTIDRTMAPDLLTVVRDSITYDRKPPKHTEK